MALAADIVIDRNRLKRSLNLWRITAFISITAILLILGGGVDYFSKKIAELNGINATKLDTNFDLFYKYEWPGNVRELRNLVERISILSINEKSVNINQLVQDSLSQKNYTETTSENVLSYPLKEAREKFEKNYLSSQLKKHKGNISKTAQFVGMERSALHRKLKSLGIKGLN